MDAIQPNLVKKFHNCTQEESIGAYHLHCIMSDSVRMQPTSTLVDSSQISLIPVSSVICTMLLCLTDMI